VDEAPPFRQLESRYIDRYLPAGFEQSRGSMAAAILRSATREMRPDDPQEPSELRLAYAEAVEVSQRID
jgi:hypothetical protein